MMFRQKVFFPPKRSSYLFTKKIMARTLGLLLSDIDHISFNTQPPNKYFLDQRFAWTKKNLTKRFLWTNIFFANNFCWMKTILDQHFFVPIFVWDQKLLSDQIFFAQIFIVPTLLSDQYFFVPKLLCVPTTFCIFFCFEKNPKILMDFEATEINRVSVYFHFHFLVVLKQF